MPYPDFTPLYTEQKDNPRPLDLGQYKPSFGEELKAWFAASWNLNPTVAGSRAYDVMTKSSGVDLDTFQDMSDADVVEFAQNYSQPPDRVPVEAQEKLLEENGLAGHLKADPAYTMPALQEIMDAKHEELLNAEVINRGSHGVLGLGMGFVAGALDPVNVVSSLFPVVNEARIAGMLANAGSFMGRTGVRLGVGGLSGAAGAAMIEPVIMSAASIAQADYGMMNSIANLFFGAGLGAGLRGVGGGIAEGVRNLRGKRQPWEYVPPDEAESVALMQAHENDIYNALRDVEFARNEFTDPAELRKQAHDVAALFDARARNHAYNEKTTIQSYYDQWRPSYNTCLAPFEGVERHGFGWDGTETGRPALADEFGGLDGPDGFWWRDAEEGAPANGSGAPDTLNHAAMYLDPETDYLAFTQKSRDKKGKQSYFILNDPELPENVRLRSDLFKHEKNRHDNLTDEDNLRLPIVLKQINGKNTIIVGKWANGGIRHLGVQTVDGIHYGYVFDIYKSGVVDVVTFFKDSLSGLKKWAAGENKKRTAQVVRKQDDNQLTPDSPFYMGQSAEKNLADFVEQVKNKLNTVLSHSSSSLPGHDILYHFAGEKGIAAADAADGGNRMANLKIAEKMENLAFGPARIKLATGWERGADGKWRYELPDGKLREGVRLKEKRFEDVIYYETKVGDILDANELFAAYPELKDMRVVFQDMENLHTLGKYADGVLILNKRLAEKSSHIHATRIAEIEKTPEYRAYERALDDTDNIADPILAEKEFDRIDSEWAATELGREYNRLLNDNRRVTKAGVLDPEAREVILHELQHAIQEKEGFAQGAGSSNPDYRLMAGEVEARNVQARMDMGAEERRNSLAAATEDMPRDRQVVVFDNGVAASIRAPYNSNPELISRFADMPFVEANISRYFGEGKAISLDGFIGRKELVDYAKKEFGTGKKFLNDDTGFEISVTVSSIRNTLGHGTNEAKALSVPFIPDLIRTGLYLGPYDKSPDFHSHFFANKLRIKEKDYVVGFVVHEDRNGNRFYDHELTKIIDPDLPQGRLNSNESGGTLGNWANQGDIINILREVLGVKDGTANILFQSTPSLPGKQAKLLGPNLDETVRYEVRELDDILPSHDPESNFRKNANYPEKAQERQYHSDIGEQEKVLANASENKFEPGHLLSDDLTAAGGPPIVTENGIVLGGNSRTMMLKLVYGRNAGKAQAYRDALKAKAQYFGIDPAGIDGMKKPVLVRAVADSMNAEEMARRSRLYNQRLNNDSNHVVTVSNDGVAAMASETDPRVARVVEIDPAIIVDKNGNNIDLFDRNALKEWLFEHYKNKTIKIKSDGSLITITKKGLNASLKRRGIPQRQAYASLDNLLENSIFEKPVEVDERHIGKVAGQKVYYAAGKIGDQYFTVKFKLDLPLASENLPSYKDHKVSQIEIAPSLYVSPATNHLAYQNKSAITGISLAVLKGDVKPSRIENNVLSQSGNGIRDNLDMTNPDALLPPEIREGGPRAQIEFDNETGRAAVTFFKSFNVASAPHELFHLFRRIIEREAKKEGASRFSKNLWRELNEAYGLKEGEAWTVAHEERFAESGIRYLAEGKAPSPGLRGVFERLKNWLLDLYVKLDRAGVEISPAMRRTFDKMFEVPYDMSDSQLRYALSEGVNANPGQPFADPAQAGGRFLPEDQAALEAERQGDLALAHDLAEDARTRAEEQAARIEREDPELAREMFAEERKELSETAKAENRLKNIDELRRQALECRMNGG